MAMMVKLVAGVFALTAVLVAPLAQALVPGLVAWAGARGVRPSGD